MDAFFGGAGGAGGGRGPRSRVQAGADALIRMRLTLEECAAGLTRELTVDTAVLCTECTGSGCATGTSPIMCDTCGGRGEVQSVQRSFLGQVVTNRSCPTCRGLGQVIPDPCRHCGGDGRVRARRSVTVKMPAGVSDGMRVRLASQGEVGSGGGPAGDLYVEVEEAPHDVFTREGVDLHCVLPLPMTAAALGTTVRLPTLTEGEELELDVEPGTQTGTVRTMRGKGLPRLRSTGRVDGWGDLMVHIEVATPTKLDPQQTELLRALAALRGEEQPEVAKEQPNRPNSGRLLSRLRRTPTTRTTPDPGTA
jgi:molecular chaperone DnaJ